MDDRTATKNALIMSTNPLLSELFDAYDVKDTGALDAAEIIAVFEDWEVRRVTLKYYLFTYSNIFSHLIANRLLSPCFHCYHLITASHQTLRSHIYS